ncbi:hypothetical protein [Pseudomonas shirazica]|uniref:hypothetical protein n=1 Tax=Pseudomonas TaxID=286 RepID=UPI001C268AB2|nr:hypothetical protein [Pseudomonas shirazica]
MQLALSHDAKEQLFAKIKASGLVDGNHLLPSKIDPSNKMRDSGLAAFRQLWHQLMGLMIKRGSTALFPRWIERLVTIYMHLMNTMRSEN